MQKDFQAWPNHWGNLQKNLNLHLKKSKSFKLYLFIFSLIFIACSSEVPETFSTGEEVYLANCSACHGKEFEGRVGPSLNANSSSASMPDSYWVQTITKGMGSMPAQRLTDTEVTMVIEYIRSKH